MSVQNIIFLYDSIVHPYYKGSSGEYEVTNSIGIIIYYIVPMCNADTCTYTVYTQCDSVYAMYVHTYYVHGRREQNCFGWAGQLCRGLSRGPCRGRERMAANTDETCTDTYIQCTAKILQCIYIIQTSIFETQS
jgi:hypothetical protein